MSKKSSFWPDHLNTVRMKWSCSKSSDAARCKKTILTLEQRNKKTWMTARTRKTSLSDLKRKVLINTTQEFQPVLKSTLSLKETKFLTPETSHWFLSTQTVWQMWQPWIELTLAEFWFSVAMVTVLSATARARLKITKTRLTRHSKICALI
jgi:hypothetical protein